MTIRAHCHTNLDDFKRCEWPDEFLAVPRVGDYVEAADGKRLRVCAITHLVIPPGRLGKPGPCIRVELHK